MTCFMLSNNGAIGVGKWADMFFNPYKTREEAKVPGLARMLRAPYDVGSKEHCQ